MTNLLGIQNVTKKPQKFLFNAVPYVFGPEEVRIETEDICIHGAKKVGIFKVLPLQTALKSAKLAEHPSVAAAKRAEEEEQKKKAEMRAEILKELRDQGMLVKEPQAQVKK